MSQLMATSRGTPERKSCHIGTNIPFFSSSLLDWQLAVADDSRAFETKRIVSKKRKGSFFMVRIVPSTIFLAVLMQWSSALSGQESPTSSVPDKATGAIRFATFNMALHGRRQGDVEKRLSSSGDSKIEKLAAIVQTIRPDVLLVNELDFEPEQRSVDLLFKNYLAKGQGGRKPLDYPYRYVAEVNTGVPSGHDLDQDGKDDGPADAFGFGVYPGQYGMAVFSRFPIEVDSIRTFRKFLWKDMPDARLPMDPESNRPFYNDAVLRDFRLSSKSHWDIPIQIADSTIHLLACHPTPPAFHGPEKRNACRNHDEIRFWADYISGDKGTYIYDDVSQKGGLAENARFVIAGDMNSDPVDSDIDPSPIQLLLKHPNVSGAVAPESHGATTAAIEQGGANRSQKGNPAADTGDFSDRQPGNLRVDYVLPSVNLPVINQGVFWPDEGEPGHELVSASDHRLVWVDVKP